MDVKNVISALDALAQESRLAIFRLLTEIAPNGMMVGAIGKQMGMPATTLSFHLDKLRQAGLISKRREGRASIYTANYDMLVGTIKYLTENCCKDSAQMPCHIIIKDKQENS
ncbi:Transcriptional regulator, ArsR family [hydrothermal vent metagenome]|uniref:Transcriptional regulator, ArsR family n=1 Tax=hydrothermal vent metagenome TaxID=652676 RepID=A0A3B0RWM0_9ZZZZ